MRKSRMPATVSLCMIVKNEESRLASCLESAQGIVSEIVIVDTGSTDRTTSVAARFGAKTADFDFRVPDFGAARNRSLDLATGEWVLVLDADESLAEGADSLVASLTRYSSNVGYVVQRRNMRAGSDEVRNDYAVRLFRNHPRHRYRGRVHETIDASILANGGRIRTTKLTIDHVHLTPEEPLAKSRFYLRILEEELATDPDNVDRLTFYCAESHKLGLMEQATRTAERIAELAPDEHGSHLNVGLYRFMHRRDRAGAARAFERALEIKPGDAKTLACLQSLSDSRV